MKKDKVLAIIMCSCTSLLILCNVIFTIVDLETYNSYCGYAISDYMINYQGGFVRRGLLGEILYQAYQIMPYKLYIVIIFINISLFFIFLWVTIQSFIRAKWVAFAPYIFIIGKILLYRRDFLMLLVAFGVFHILFKFMTSHKMSHLVMTSLICTIAVLIYEPSFFFIVPMGIILLWVTLDNLTTKEKLYLLSCAFLMPIVSMFAVCIFKGNKEIAHSIWESWLPLFDRFNVNTPEELVIGISYLGNNNTDIFCENLKHTFGLGEGLLGVNLFYCFGFLLFIIGFYYLTIWMPKQKRLLCEKSISSDVFISQFLCLFPMFSVLSCDFGRTILYVMFTTCFIIYEMNTKKLYFRIPVICRVSDSIISKTKYYKFLDSLWFYILVVFLVPFKRWFGISPLHNFVMEYWDMIEPLKHYFSQIGL